MMQQQPPPPPLPSVASSLPTGEPQFATVTFVSDDNTTGSTLRVPLNNTTTVSRLAKDAMKRLVLSRPRDDRHGSFASIAVTEVYVGGSGSQPKAEIFAQDVVSQVVLVREEVIFLKLRAATASTAPSRQPTPPPPTSATAADATAGSASAQAGAAAVERPAKEAAKTSTAAAHDAHVTERPTRRAADTSSSSSSAAAAAKTAAQPARPGWGPEAYNRFPDNYESTPGKRLRQACRPAPAAAKRTKTETTTKEVEKATATESGGTGRPGVEGERGLRWGPEAAKSFPANYVSSPEKLARLARQQRRAAKEAAGVKTQATAPSAKPLASGRVSRELQFPAEQADDGRATVGHAVQAEVFTVEEDTPAVDLPKGWGAQSLRFFDPNTYCDDPTKARLLPNMNLSRSTRRRRPASP